MDLKRYRVHVSNDALSWMLVKRFFLFRSARDFAFRAHYFQPYLFIQVTDSWRNYKDRLFIKADLDAMKARMPKVVFEEAKCGDD